MCWMVVKRLTRVISFTLKMEATRSPETSVNIKATRRRLSSAGICIGDAVCAPPPPHVAGTEFELDEPNVSIG
jgi:hypothetical protein